MGFLKESPFYIVDMRNKMDNRFNKLERKVTVDGREKNSNG